MNIHDSGYKRLFSNRTIFQQLLETFVDQEWVHSLDFDKCESLDKSFISEHYKETESDLIYKIQFQDRPRQDPARNREIYIYILIEFQSRVEPFMALRVLNYLTNFYMDFLVNNKGIKKLPPVFPIVLYNGNAPWTAPVNLSALIEQTPPLGRFALDFEYFLIAENEYSREALLKIRNIVSTLFLAESNYNTDALVAELTNLFSAEDDKAAASLLINWFKQLSVHGQIKPADYQALEHVYQNAEEVKTMLGTALEKDRQRFFQNGLREGEQRGRIEEKIETAKAMLAKGMEIPLISEITNLPEAQLLQLKEELALIER